MNRPGVPLTLQLDESNDFANDSLKDFDTTFRAATGFGEEISVSGDRMRMNGETFGDSGLHAQLRIGKKLGSGACSTVHYAEHITTGKPYAIKLFNVYDRSRRQQMINELGMLASVNCDTLIQFHSAYCNEGHIGVIIEYMDFGSLDLLMKREYKISESGLAGISYQILWGLAYLHHDSNLHRDIKPGNVLMNTKGQCKLSDFGISKQLDGPQSMSETVTGSFRFMSPERLYGDVYNASSDIWSVGIMLMQLYEQKYPFLDAATTPLELSSEFEDMDINKILSSSSYPIELAKFIASTLQYKPEDRHTAIQLLSSKWLHKFGASNLDSAVQILERWVSPLFYNTPKSAEQKMSFDDQDYPEDFVDGVEDELSPTTSNRLGKNSKYPKDMSFDEYDNDAACKESSYDMDDYPKSDRHSSKEYGKYQYK